MRGRALQGLPVDAELVRERFQVAGEQVVVTLRSGVDGEATVPGLDWSVAECAAHTVTAIRAAAGYARGEPAPVATVVEVAEVNTERVASLDERDPGRLADRLEEACAGSLRSFGSAVATNPSSGASGRLIWTWRRWPA